VLTQKAQNVLRGGFLGWTHPQQQSKHELNNVERTRRLSLSKSARPLWLLFESFNRKNIQSRGRRWPGGLAFPSSFSAAIQICFRLFRKQNNDIDLSPQKVQPIPVLGGVMKNGKPEHLICSGAFERTLDLNNDPVDQSSQHTAEQGDDQMKRGDGKKKQETQHEQSPTRRECPAPMTRDLGCWMIEGVDAVNKEIRQPKADVEQTGTTATEKASEHNGTDSSAFHAQSCEQRTEGPAHKTDPQRADKPGKRHKSMRPD
jgi:hypothetical protein